MPQYDLAGNPLPEPTASGHPMSPPSGQRLPPAPLPPRYDAQGRQLHLATPPAAAPPVRYDLAGNPLPPLPAATPEAQYSAPPVSGYGYGAGGATWPPAPGPMASYGQSAFQNNSGQQSGVPPEIARLRWHWGAFFFPILWCKKHGMTTVAATLGGTLLVLRWARRITFFVNPAAYLLLVLVYGVLYFSIAVYFGFTGHGYGWRNRRFESVQDYLSCQTKWMWWGLGINTFLVVILPLLFVLGILGAASLSGGSGNSPSGYSSPNFSPPADGASGQPDGTAGQ